MPLGSAGLQGSRARLCSFPRKSTGPKLLGSSPSSQGCCLVLLFHWSLLSPTCTSDCTSQASPETPGSVDRGSTDDFILVSKEDEGGSAKGSFSGHAQPLRTLRSTSGRSEPLVRSPLVFSDPLMGPASASSSNPSSSPDEDSSNNSKDSGFTIVSPLDI